VEETQAQAQGVPYKPQGFKKEALGKWELLQSEALGAPQTLAASLSSVSDLRVAPLIQSHWSQLDDNGLLCYNYYTPDNYCCGCVATAMAQIMRYFQWPASAVVIRSFPITVDGFSQNAPLLGGSGNGGSYDWADMVLAPNGATTDAQRRAIGALTHDTGVAAQTSYTADGSSADPAAATTAFVNTFGFSNAAHGFSMNTIPTAGSLIPMINPTLDAASFNPPPPNQPIIGPVLLGIYTSSIGGPGHAVVADGYGYDTNTLYHHLNLGWAGLDDAWYNLPTINVAGYSFSEVGDCIYNIYTSGAGEIISGRVLDARQKPVNGATVTANRTGGGAYRATTNPQGIYALARVPSSSTYTIAATKAGFTVSSRVVATGRSQNDTTITGNLWQIDFTLRSRFLEPILGLLLSDH
jgi:hypothetical protein